MLDSRIFCELLTDDPPITFPRGQLQRSPTIAWQYARFVGGAV